MASREKDLDSDDSMIHFGDPREVFSNVSKEHLFRRIDVGCRYAALGLKVGKLC